MSLCFKISNNQVLRKEKKDAMARWVVANDVTLEQVTRCSCLFNRIMCSLSPVQYFGLPIFESSREETASQKIDLRLRAMVRVAEHKAVRSLLN